MPGSNKSSKNNLHGYILQATLDQKLLKASTSLDDDWDKIEDLIKEGADVDARDKNAYGSTALMLASKLGHEKIVRELCRLGADVNATDNNGGVTALMLAIINKNVKNDSSESIVSYLCEHGAIVDIQNNSGHTALMLASKLGHKKIVGELLKAGADPTLKNNKGKSAYSLAKNLDIIELLSKRINGTTPENIFEEVYPPSRTWPNSTWRENLTRRKAATRREGGGKLKKGKRTLKTKKRR